ncbi:hypothetical protein ACFWWM_12430 [Streptomyces sp. NPDC058682]|uniref:hypothetical protein n=1 Tax=Streptomyces sp. NPDC058682 TaxID=3346596 RepID=UPI00364D4270
METLDLDDEPVGLALAGARGHCDHVDVAHTSIVADFDLCRIRYLPFSPHARVEAGVPAGLHLHLGGHLDASHTKCRSVRAE